jgi:hypothetical protein
MNVNIRLSVERKEISIEVKNKLTNEMKIDNLEKFAKTSLAAEVILDRPK